MKHDSPAPVLFMWLCTITGFQVGLESWLRVVALIASIGASAMVGYVTWSRRKKITSVDVSLGN